MLLGIKIGNSNTAFGVYRPAGLALWRVQTRTDGTADEYAVLLSDLIAEAGLSLRDLHAAILVSVVPSLTTTLRELCRRYLQVEPFVVGPECQTGVEVLYDDPSTLGPDRLAPVVGVRAKYGAPAILVDLGTATTFNVLDREGRFAGGAIVPGLNLTAQALHQYTAKLPLVDLAVPRQAIATNTVEAIRSGVIYGYAGLVTGLIDRLRAEMREPHAPVIATGGLAHIISPLVPAIRVVDPEITFDGLRLIYELNHVQPSR